MTSPTRPRAARKGSPQKTHARAIADVVDGLPASGAILLVHAHGELPATRRLVQIRRGRDVADLTRIVVAATEADEKTAVGAVSIPVFRFPFLAEQRAHAAALAEVWSA